MIVGIGNDIVELERIKKVSMNKAFLERYFTKREIALFEMRKMNPETIGANFSAKEAVSKVFGTGVVGFSLKDIEVLRDDQGKPYINLFNRADEKAKNLGIDKMHITVSHNKTMVSVVVIGESDDSRKK